MTDTATPRNKPYAPRMLPEQRREQLLDVVLDIINADGVGAVSIDGVARRAGVSRPVVYGVFVDANDMLRGSLDREERRALAQLAGVIPNGDQGDLAGSFRRLADALLRAVAEAPDRWRAIYLIADSGTPAFHKRVERGRAAMIGQLEQALRASTDFGAHADVEMLARYLLAALWDSGRLLLTRPDEYPHDRLLQALRQLIGALLATR